MESKNFSDIINLAPNGASSNAPDQTEPTNPYQTMINGQPANGPSYRGLTEEVEINLRGSTREKAKQVFEEANKADPPPTGPMGRRSTLNIPTNAQLAEGVPAKPYTNEELEQSKDKAFIESAFPVGSEINIPTKEGDIIRGYIIDISEDQKGVYLRVIFQTDGNTLKKKDISALAAITQNPPGSVKKDKLSREDVANLKRWVGEKAA